MSLTYPPRIPPIVILLLAFFLRVIAIDRIPPGLSHDEAYNGVTAMQVLDGQRLIFFEINKGIEPLIIYLEALAFYAFGIGPVPMRLVNVICGLLTVALVYPLAKRLFNRRVALLAMAGLAVSFWAIFTSRLALRAVILPPLLMLTLYFLWCGLVSSQKSVASSQKLLSNLQPSNRQPSIFHLPSSIFFALSGLAAGATMYTYLSSRFVPLLLLAVFAYQLLRRQVTKWHWLGMLLLFLLWAIIFAPLAVYFWQHAASFTERSSQVSTLPYALNGDFGPLLRHTGRTLGMFTFHGDETDRYNLDGRPVFDWLNGLLFYLGLGLALLRLRQPVNRSGAAALLLLWFFFMLLPGFITDDSPHFLRTIGAMPVVYLFWAIGLDWVSQRIEEARTQGREDARSSLTLHASRFTLLPLALTLLMLFHGGYDYFIRWANAAEARTIYGADIAEVARYVNATRDEGLAAISAEYYRDLDPFRFSLHSYGRPPFVIWFDGRQSLAFPPPESGLSPRYIFPRSAPPAELWQPFLQPVPAESGQEYMLYHLPPATVLRQAETALFSPQNKVGVKVNDDLVLSAYQLLGSVTSGGKFQVLLAWQALRALPPETDYTFLVQLQDNQGHVWAAADGNGYPAGAWQPGVQGLQLLLLRLPGDLPPRPYTLTAQVIDRRSGQALSTAGGEPLIRLGSTPGQLAKTPRLLDPAQLPNPMQVVQANGLAAELALRGYEVKNPHVRPGEELALTLHWQVLQPPQQDYRLQFFLTHEQGEILYRWPALPPINGEWPTRRWPADYWVQDRLNLPLGADVPPGQFRLRAIWIAEETQSVPAVVSGEAWPGFDLGWVTVTNNQ
ncbi:MAG: glycosyltransferase family 39 protein [Anaerolineae bacterium]|nr:glycosyltransferase family 39 protein [Anaerolineae bacterium]